MKQLYTVTISTEQVVLADSEAAAVSVARSTVSDLSAYDYDIEPELMSSLPGNWEADCLPYGGDGDRTIAEYIEAGSAPGYVELQERLATANAEIKARSGR